MPLNNIVLMLKITESRFEGQPKGCRIQGTAPLVLPLIPRDDSDSGLGIQDSENCDHGDCLVSEERVGFGMQRRARVVFPES